MYTTKIKRFLRRFNFIRRFKRDEINLINLYNRILILIKKNDKKSLCIELEKYIESLNFKKNRFSIEEKVLIKNTIKIIIKENKIKNIKIKNESSVIKIISLSGFGYSGTGAIHDFLRDFRNTFDVLNGRELDLFKYDYSLYNLYLKSFSKNKKISEHDIYKFLFNHFLGLPYPGGVTPDEINNRLVGSKSLLNAILRLPRGKERTILVRDICLFAIHIFYLKNIEDQKNNLEIISQNLINNIGKYYKQKYPTKKHLILNNWIPASIINMVNLLPEESTTIICTREALDAYYSWSSECPRIKLNLKILIFPYIFLYFVRHIHFSKNYKLVNKNILKNIHYIYFEDFILRNTKKNGNLFYKNLFSLDCGKKNYPLKFNPHKSKNNINNFYRYTKPSFFKISAIIFNFILSGILKNSSFWTFSRK